MVDANHEFTNVSNFRPESVGEPGKRTFRILITSASSSAIIWLEKEQLFQLGLAIQQMLADLSIDHASEASLATDREAAPLTRLDFKVAKLVLGFDSSKGLFIIDAYNSDVAEATVRVWVDEEQINAFSEEALEVCASGRPFCPLCSNPMDVEGHRCARTNGFVKLHPDELAGDI